MLLCLKKEILYMKRDYLIAVDLDGTLVTGFDNYDKVSFELLKELANTNYVVIATGRPYRSSKYYYDLLNLRTHIINYNGALIHHPTDPVFEKAKITIDRKIVYDLIEDNKDILINVFCEIEDEIFLWKDNEEIKPYLHLDGGILSTGNLNQILKGDPNGAIVLSKLGTEKKLTDYINNKYHGTLNIRFWNANEITVSEIYSPLTSKGNALKVVANYYHIPNDKIIAIGDGHNDIEMIEFAKVGVAMGNCHPDLLKVANERAKSVEDHGVYHFLKKYFEL
jgi:Cof subfamily protein (haloacid dehalogenase superfamily)